MIPSPCFILPPRYEYTSSICVFLRLRVLSGHCCDRTFKRNIETETDTNTHSASVQTGDNLSVCTHIVK